MNKIQLKQLISEIIKEQTLSAEEANSPINVAAKQIFNAIKSKPIYKNIEVRYVDRYDEGGFASIHSKVNKTSIFFVIYGPNMIDVKIDDSSDPFTVQLYTSRRSKSVSDVINFSKNPLVAISPNPKHQLTGATIDSVIDLRNNNFLITLTTVNGKQYKAKLSFVK